MVKKWNRIFKITLTRRHSGCCDLDLPLMSSAMFEAAFASQQLSHRRATDFRKKNFKYYFFIPYFLSQNFTRACSNAAFPTALLITSSP